jgi:hypothetical protein
METLPLPSNETLLAFSAAVPWQHIEDMKRTFNAAVKSLASHGYEGALPLDDLSSQVGVKVTAYYPDAPPEQGNVYLADINGQRIVLGSTVSARYRSGKTSAQALVPYNFNPSVNHTNLDETEHSQIVMRALGAEVELGLLHPDGRGPEESEVHTFIRAYQQHARRIGVTPQIDREACQYQVECHVAPGVGYQLTRASLEGILSSLVAAAEVTGLYTAIMSSYPIQSDFKLTDDPKVNTARDLMIMVNGQHPSYGKRLEDVRARYQLAPDANVIEAFRIQGCHIHLDVAGRSEALGLLAFYTLLHSATAVANSAILKGGPFVNGVCDAERTCTREYIRSTTVTGRPLNVPLTPHLSADGMEKYAELLKSEKVNSVVRAMLYEDGLGTPNSAMHNVFGRLRPDLGSTKRICTLESTGMPVNISVSRQAAVLTDFEFSHALIEHYFREHGSDLGPMYENTDLLEILGPLDADTFQELHDASDRNGNDITLKTAAGTEMSIPEFYEKKRAYMHRVLPDIVSQIRPRDIDDVYSSLQRMLAPLSGHVAQTVEQYIANPRLRSTGNWGRILRNAFIEEGGTPGTSNPDAVLRVVKRVHLALRSRYMSNE